MISMKKLLAKLTMSANPVGTILPYYGTTAPAGWLLCDGSAIPSKYSELISLVGANTPNLKGRCLVGYNSDDSDFNALGKTGGEKAHQLSNYEMPIHTHRVTTDTTNYFSAQSTAGAVPCVANGSNGYVRSAYNATTGEAGYNYAHNNLQPYAVVSYIICTGGVA